MKPGTTKITVEQESKQRLLKAATELFAKKGYAATSIREIVAEAGVTKPVLYYYFKNKKGIFNAIIKLTSEKYEEILSEICHRSGNCVERLIELYQRLSQVMAELPNISMLFHRVILDQSQGIPELGLEDFPLRIIESIKNIYKEGLARGEVAEHDPDAVALLFLSLLGLPAHRDASFMKSMSNKVPLQTVQLALSCLQREETET